MRDKIEISNVSGIVNYRSTLTTVTQTVQAMPRGTAEDKEALESLVSELVGALEALPAEKGDEAEAVDTVAKTLIDEVAKPEPNKTLVNVTCNGLRQAATTIADVAPKVLSTAEKIIDFVSRLTG